MPSYPQMNNFGYNPLAYAGLEVTAIDQQTSKTKDFVNNQASSQMSILQQQFDSQKSMLNLEKQRMQEVASQQIGAKYDMEVN